MRSYLLLALTCMFLPLAARAQTELVIESLDSAGSMTFNRTSNAVSYRVEWAPTADGPWTNTWEMLADIPGEGSDIITGAVPMVYRVVATVTNPPVPTGMSLIPGGEFVMGDAFGDGIYFELPLHTNVISAFYMDKYEVTRALWNEVKAFNGGNGYSYANPGEGKALNHPVQTVNWFDVVKWCNARSQRDGLTPVYYTDAGFTTVYKTGEISPHADWSANGYRLPTEAEWEKAARGGMAVQRFPWGDTITHSNANYYSSSSRPYDTNITRDYHPMFLDEDYPYTSPVGYFAPNGYGLYDMAGNVFEWCWDWFGESYYSSSPLTDPRGPSSGDYAPPTRVLRGGSWNDDAFFARVANRVTFFPDGENHDYGFRCARGL